MEWVLVLIGVVLLYRIVRKYERAKAERIEAIEELRRFTIDVDDFGDRRSEWRVDFESMTVDFETSSLDGDERTPYLLRRADGGAWQIRLTDAGYRSERARCMRRRSEGRMALIGLSDREEYIERAYAQWLPMPDEFTGPLESRFQRFIRRG